MRTKGPKKKNNKKKKTNSLLYRELGEEIKEKEEQESDVRIDIQGLCIKIG